MWISNFLTLHVENVQYNRNYFIVKKMYTYIILTYIFIYVNLNFIFIYIYFLKFIKIHNKHVFISNKISQSFGIIDLYLYFILVYTFCPWVRFPDSIFNSEFVTLFCMCFGEKRECEKVNSAITPKINGDCSNTTVSCSNF